MKGQKEAVSEQVLIQLPTFEKFKDNALQLLSPTQLESIKVTIFQDILAGRIEYSKDLTQVGEVRAYARSMVMNHLKKAKELNGGAKLASGLPQSSVTRVRVKLAPKGVDLDLLPEELKEYAKTLV